MRTGAKQVIEILTKDVGSADIIEAVAVANISAAVLAKRMELKMNQKEFAEHMGVSQSEVSKWENGDSSFKISLLAKIADKLDIESIAQLVGDKKRNVSKLKVCEHSNKNVKAWSGMRRHYCASEGGVVYA